MSESEDHDRKIQKGFERYVGFELAIYALIFVMLIAMIFV
jgi:hypothetical protein